MWAAVPPDPECKDPECGAPLATGNNIVIKPSEETPINALVFAELVTFTGPLSVESSPAFVHAPEGNGCTERFIRTLKENLLWVRVSTPSSSSARR